MAGGTWTKQDKVRPGVYINFTSESQRGSVSYTHLTLPTKA